MCGGGEVCVFLPFLGCEAGLDVDCGDSLGNLEGGGCFCVGVGVGEGGVLESGVAVYDEVG